MSSLSNTQYNSRSMNGLINVNANSGTFTDLEVNNLVVNQSGTAPTMISTDNSTHIATTAFVNSHASGIYVTLSTDQTITGEKTFTNLNTNITGGLNVNYISNSSSIDTPAINSGLGSDTLNFCSNQTSGVLNIGCRTNRTGAINIGTLTTTNPPINIGSTSSTTQTIAIRSNTLKLNNDYPASSNTIEVGNNNSSINVYGSSTFDNPITANASIINNDVASFQNGAFFDNVCPYSNVAPSGSTDLTRKSYVDNNFVSLSGTQTITGSKLFNTVCPQSSVAPSNTNDLVNYGWVNTNISNNMNPTGTIIMYPSSTAPSGYLLCDGTTYNTTAYAALWSVIFYTYGGSGNNFKVPNFQGCFLRGAGSQTTGGVTYTAAALGTIQQDQVLQTDTYATNEGYRDCGSGTRSCVARSRITGDPVDTNTGILAQFQRQGTENRPVNHAIYYYIKYL